MINIKRAIATTLVAVTMTTTVFSTGTISASASSKSKTFTVTSKSDVSVINTNLKKKDCYIKVKMGKKKTKAAKKKALKVVNTIERKMYNSNGVATKILDENIDHSYWEGEETVKKSGKNYYLITQFSKSRYNGILKTYGVIQQLVNECDQWIAWNSQWSEYMNFIASTTGTVASNEDESSLSTGLWKFIQGSKDSTDCFYNMFNIESDAEGSYFMFPLDMYHSRSYVVAGKPVNVNPLAGTKYERYSRYDSKYKEWCVRIPLYNKRVMSTQFIFPEVYTEIAIGDYESAYRYFQSYTEYKSAGRINNKTNTKAGLGDSTYTLFKGMLDGKIVRYVTCWYDSETATKWMNYNGYNYKCQNSVKRNHQEMLKVGTNSTLWSEADISGNYKPHIYSKMGYEHSNSKVYKD